MILQSYDRHRVYFKSLHTYNDVVVFTHRGILGTFVILTVLATLIEGCFWFEYDYGLEEKKQGQKSLDAAKTEANGNANGGFHHHPSDKISKEMEVCC